MDSIYRELGAPEHLYGDDAEPTERWRDLAAKQGLRLVRSPVRHLGTERAAGVMVGYAGRVWRARSKCKTGTAVTATSSPMHAGSPGVVTADGRDLPRVPRSSSAPGREGSHG